MLENSRRRPKRQRAAKEFRMWAEQLESLFELEHRWQPHWGQKLLWEIFKWEVVKSGSGRNAVGGTVHHPAKQV